MEALDAGEGRDAHAHALGREPLGRLDRERHLGAGGEEEDGVGVLGAGDVDVVAALGDALGGHTVQHRHVLPRRQEAARARRVLEDLHPGEGGLVRVGRPPRHHVRHRAERGEVLDRLVGGTVLAHAVAVVREDVDGRHLHQRREADRRAAVVGEDEERGRVAAEGRVEGGEAVDDRGHAELAHAEVDVAPVERAGADVAEPLEDRLVRRPQVGAAADEAGDERRERVHHRAAGRAGGDRLRGVELRQRGDERGAVRHVADRALPSALLPLEREAVERVGARLEDLVHLVRHDEGPLRVEAEGALERRGLLRAERRAVAVGGVLLGRGAAADHGVGDDDHRLALHLRRAAVGGADGVVVVAVGLEHLPAVAREALLDVVGEGERGGTLDGDAVGVVDEHQVVELHRPGPAARLVADALLEVAVATEDPGLVGDMRLLRGEREADAHRDALAERAGGHLHAGQKAALRVPRAARAPLAEGLELVHRETAHAGEVEKRVDERARMPAGEDEAVAPGPERVLGVYVEELEPQDEREVRHSHRGAGVAGVGLVDHVRAEAADGSRSEIKLVVGWFHR